MGRAIEPRKTEHQDADSLLRRGRQHGCFAITRASSRSCVVLEPAHAEKQHAREPGDLWSASTRKGTRPVREGAKPHGGRARSGGVGPRHTIDEPANKEERSSAEPGEKRARAKENIVQSDTSPTQCGEVSVPRIVRCASSSIARQSSKVGAVCGSAARTVLCGGRSVMVVPTAST